MRSRNSKAAPAIAIRGVQKLIAVSSPTPMEASAQNQLIIAATLMAARRTYSRGWSVRTKDLPRTISHGAKLSSAKTMRQKLS